MRWGRWWGVWLPWGSRLRWHLVSKVNPILHPCWRESAALWSPDKGSRWGRPRWWIHSRTLHVWTGTSTSSSEALSVMNSVDVTTFALGMKVWFWWVFCTLWNWVLCISTLRPGIHLHHPCEHHGSRWTDFLGSGWTPAGGSEKAWTELPVLLIWTRSLVCVRVAVFNVKLKEAKINKNRGSLNRIKRENSVDAEVVPQTCPWTVRSTSKSL